VGSALGEDPRRSKARAIESLRVNPRADFAGTLVRRYKRFLADVEARDGTLHTVHCPNPGSMLGCARPGSAVRCSTSDNPKRKLRHTLEMIRVGRIWVGLHTLRANEIAGLALDKGAIRKLAGYSELRREVVVPGGSRLDFRLDHHHRDPRPAYVEVKSVTLAEGRLARFPDSVTERGRRHMDTLAKLCEEGARAALLFVVQRGDCERVEPADDIDPAYGKALRSAAARGVEVFAVRARVTAKAIRLESELPVDL
jgi:sugar fermentation stimulation protein A